jgi:hypothetical protein
VIASRRTPLAADLAPLRRGNTTHDGGALTSISAAEAQRIRDTDPEAAAALRRYVTAITIYTDDERWCIWLDDADSDLVHRSPVLQERADRVMSRRRRTAVPPWRFAERRQPDRPFFALPTHRPHDQVLRMARFDPDTIVNDQVWTLEDDSLVTAGIVESHLFEVWRTVVEVHGRGKRRVITSDVYNSFPCPKLTTTQRHRIEESMQDVLIARAHAGAASLDELYGQPELPRPLREAHDRLNSTVGRVFGVKATMSDADVGEMLLDRYQQLIAWAA